MRIKPAFGRKHSGLLKVRDFDLDIKMTSLSDDGVFEGYGSVFGGDPDSYGEIVAKGAFLESLAKLKALGRTVPVLWQHRSSEPIGIYEEIREDEHGLFVRGRLLIKDVARAAEAFALMKAGAVTGLSIGYWVVDATYDAKTEIRLLKKLDLVEVSLVTFPAKDDARVESVKFKLAHGELPTEREFEKFLREVGFSKSRAQAVVAHGLAEVRRRESDQTATIDPALKGISDTLNAFSLKAA
jgi:HK97 family phage prohead protease